MTQHHVMIDLETLGTAPGSALLSIGAVKFDLVTGQIGREFHVAVTLQSGVLAGMTIDAGTLAWWMAPERQAAREVQAGMSAVPLPLALEEFAHWLTHDENEVTTLQPEVWCKGGSFDFPILGAGFRLIGQDVPWKFWNENCCRTLFAVAKKTHGFRLAKVPGTAHCALDDARHQAEQVIACLRLLRGEASATAA